MTTANRIAREISKKVLPAALLKALQNEFGEHAKKRTAFLSTVTGEDYRYTAYDAVRWSGGTRTYVLKWSFGSETFVQMEPADGTQIAVEPGFALVVVGFFCGTASKPTVMVRSQDLPKFYGVELPAEFDTVPAEYAADYIQEQAAHRGRKEAKKLEAFAELLRGLVAPY